MPMINLAQPLSLLIATILFVLMLWFAYESKKSVITGILLFIFIASLILHTVEFCLGDLTDMGLVVTMRSITFDLVFVFLSFISYLWIDDIEAKLKKKKVVSNSLDWFWGKV